jgi:flagellar motor switch protein FliM
MARPALFSPEETAVVEQVFNRFSTLAARALSSILNSDVVVKYAGITAGSRNDLFDYNPYVVIDLQADIPPAVVQMELSLARCFVEASVGGKPSGGAVEARPITALEQRLLVPFFDLLTSGMVACWPKHNAVPRAAKARAGGGAARLAAIFDTAPIQIVGLEITLFEVTERMNIVIPVHTLRSICQLSDAPAITIAPTADHPVALVFQTLASTTICVRAEVHGMRMALGDLLTLQIDDVLVGELALAAPLTVHLNGLPKYEGRAVLVDGERAIELRTQLHATSKA